MATAPITDPNDPNYDPAKDPNFMEQAGDPSGGQGLYPTAQSAGAPLMDAEYNQDGSIKNPLLQGRDEQDGNYRGTDRTTDLEGNKLAPPGMPPVNPADGPWATDVVPTGWARFPTEEEVAYLSEAYPMQKGAPYQPGGHGIEEDKTREPVDTDAREAQS